MSYETTNPIGASSCSSCKPCSIANCARKSTKLSFLPQSSIHSLLFGNAWNSGHRVINTRLIITHSFFDIGRFANGIHMLANVLYEATLDGGLISAGCMSFEDGCSCIWTRAIRDNLVVLMSGSAAEVVHALFKETSPGLF